MTKDESAKNSNAPSLNEKSCYRSLAPTSNVENAEEYLAALSWAVNQEDIHNIAISGPYGSGKSSIIKSFLNENSRKGILHISLASFKFSGNEESINPEDQINNLEGEILKQIFYSVSSKRIPRSRFRKITEVKWINTLIPALVLMAFFLIVLIVFSYERLQAFVKTINEMPNGWPIIVCLVTIGLLFVLFCVVVKWFKENASIGEVKFFDKVELKTNESDKNSVFNKNMDEIVYFFEKTKTEIVIIEDLDRFESPSIFSALRNLNTLLNNNEKINGRIKFIYAIKDDLFIDSKERTKFFDFIIPIVPVVSSTNSNEVLRELLVFDNANNRSSLYDISGLFITKISPYINDMRDIICVCNEFIVFKNTLKGNQKLDLDDEKMFSLIVFKNLYPKAFSELEEENDNCIVKRAFINKQSLINEKNRIIEEFQEKETRKLNEIKRESLKTVKELKSALLYSITNPPEAISKIIIEGTSYPLSTILSDSFDVNLLKKQRITIHTASGIPRSITDAENIINSSGNYFERIDRLLKGLEDCTKQTQQLITEYKQEINNINSWSMMKAISSIGVDFLDEEVTNNLLLVFLLRNGYIDETYGSYINYFRPNSITKDEMNYILGIRNHISERDYSFHILNAAHVYDRLLDYEFKQPEILNYDMVDYVLAYKSESSALGFLMEQLSNQSDISLDFIKSYINRGINKEVFVYTLSKHNTHLCKDILNDETISLDEKYEYVGLILQHSDIVDIISQDNFDHENKPLTKFILDNSDSLSRLIMIPVEKLLSVIQGLGIVFCKTDLEDLDDRIKDYVYSNDKYVMNVHMLKQFVKWKRPDLIDMFNTQNYASLISIEYDPVLNRIANEFAGYISNVFLKIETNTNEKSENINKIIDALLPDYFDLSIQVLNQSSAIWQEVANCCSDSEKDYGDTKYRIWKYLFSNDRVSPTVDNVMSYFVVYTFDDTLEKFFERHETILLERINDSVVSYEFKNSVFYSHISPKAFRSFILEADFDFDISDFKDLGMEKTRILIDEDILSFSVQDWIKIHALWPDLCVKFAINNTNDFMLSIHDVVIDEKTLIALFDSDAFTVDDKKRILCQFDVKEMTELGANIISKVGFIVPKQYSDSAWKILNLEQRVQLLTNQLANYSLIQISNMLGEMGPDYSLLVAGKRHQYSIPYTDANDCLVEKLHSIGYVTSKKIHAKGTEDHNAVISGFVKEITL